MKSAIEKGKKISKGYRLSPETHKLIDKLKQTLRTDAETVLSSACSQFLKYVVKKFPINYLK